MLWDPPLKKRQKRENSTHTNKEIQAIINEFHEYVYFMNQPNQSTLAASPWANDPQSSHQAGP
jgi:hypothetical protein